MNNRRKRNSGTAAGDGASRVAEAAAAYISLPKSLPITAHIDDRLHARSGNLDARRISKTLGVPPNRLAQAVGYTPQGLLKNPTADKLQPALAEIAYMLSTLNGLLRDERSVAVWLRAPHPDLGGSTPLSFVLSGKTSTILTLLHLAESGQTS